MNSVNRLGGFRLLSNSACFCLINSALLMVLNPVTTSKIQFYMIFLGMRFVDDLCQLLSDGAVDITTQIAR